MRCVYKDIKIIFESIFSLILYAIDCYSEYTCLLSDVIERSYESYTDISTFKINQRTFFDVIDKFDLLADAVDMKNIENAYTVTEVFDNTIESLSKKTTSRKFS